MFDALKNIAKSLTAKPAVLKAVSPNDRNSVELSVTNILPIDIILGIFIISILGVIILG
ncbi:MAG: hypothetical protein ACM34J_00590 [Ignavibacteria bacterium]